MSKRNKIIVSIVGISIVLLALLGLTYAYYLTRIEGNTNTNSISVTTADLKLTYNDGDGSIIGSNKTLIPDSNNPVGTKVFTVTNSGNEIIEDYAVILENFAVRYVSNTGNIEYGEVTEFKNGEDGNPDMKLVISCKSYKNYGTADKAEVGTCNGMDGFLPEKSDILLTNTIDKDITHEYTAVLTYLEDGTDQSDDMNKTITGKFNIIDTKNTIDITGTVETYTKGDKVTINSEYKESVIYTDGTYKFMGVKPDIHTIKVNGVEKGKISIKGGTTANINENATVNGTTMPEVTITNDSRVLTINLTNIVQVGTMTNLEKRMVLADTIIKNASQVSKSDSQTYGYAILGEFDTTPAEAASLETEAVLATTEDDYTATTGKPSYYFRGNVKNNYANFAGMCWRIVRIEGDGSVKLILEDRNEQCNDKEGQDLNKNGKYFTGNWNEEELVQFGYKLHDYWGDVGKISEFVNYDGGLADSFQNFQNLKLLNKINKLKVDEWCYDKSITNFITQNGYNALEDYGPQTRIYKDKNPSLKCMGTKISKYKDNTDMYVGTLTVDEVSFAGAYSSNNNTNNYLMGEKQNNYWWWLLSPYQFFVDIGTERIFTTNGTSLSVIVVYDYYGQSNLSYSRPAVTLKSGCEISGGNGIITNPYIID